MRKEEFILLLLGSVLGMASKYVLALVPFCAAYFVVVLLFYFLYLLKFLPKKFYFTGNGLMDRGWLFQPVCVIIILYMIGNIMTYYEVSYYKYVARIGYFSSIALWGGSFLYIAFGIAFGKIDLRMVKKRAFYLFIRCVGALALCAYFIPAYQYSYSVSYTGDRLLSEYKLDGRVCTETIYVDSINNYITEVTDMEKRQVIYYNSYPENISRIDTFYFSKE